MCNCYNVGIQLDRSLSPFVVESQVASEGGLVKQFFSRIAGSGFAEYLPDPQPWIVDIAFFCCKV